MKDMDKNGEGHEPVGEDPKDFLPIDRKYVVNGEITKRDGTVIPSDQVIIFRAHDPLLPEMLIWYAIELRKTYGADKHTIDTVFSLRKRVMNYQAANPDLIKTPDTTKEDISI